LEKARSGSGCWNEKRGKVDFSRSWFR
jgi:hypothetical protein